MNAVLQSTEQTDSWSHRRTTKAARLARIAPRTRSTITFDHPSGTFSVDAEAETVDGKVKVKLLRVFRTARRIMEGYVYVPKSVFK